MNNPVTSSTQMQEITEAIVKAVPEVVERCVRKCDKCKIKKMVDGVEDKCCGDAVFPCSGILRRDNNYKHEVRRPITLEDVLKAINIADTELWFNADASGNLAHGFTGKKYHWHLGLPLHQQSEDTIRFLHSLLVCGNN